MHHVYHSLRASRTVLLHVKVAVKLYYIVSKISILNTGPVSMVTHIIAFKTMSYPIYIHVLTEQTHVLTRQCTWN